MEEFNKLSSQVACKSDHVIEESYDNEDSDVYINNRDDLFWVENEIVVAEDIIEDNLGSSSLVNDDSCRKSITKEKCNFNVSVFVSEENRSTSISENVVKSSNSADSLENIKGKEEEDVENKLWKYFTKHNSSQLRCDLCSGLFIYQNNDLQLLRHVEAAHNIPMGFPVTSTPTLYQSCTTSQTCQGKNNSKTISDVGVNDNCFSADENKKLLTYFTKMDSGRFRCNLCCRILFSLQQVVILRHFQSYHVDIFTSITGRTSVAVSNFDSKGENENSTSKLVSIISHHFSKLKSPNKIKCNQCQTVLKNGGRNNNNLIRHLQKKHLDSLIEINDILSQDSSGEFSIDMDQVVEFDGKDKTVVIEATEERENIFVANTGSISESYISRNEQTGSSILFEQQDNSLDVVGGKIETMCSNKAKNEIVTINKSKTNINKNYIQRNELWNYFLRLESTKEIKCKVCSQVMYIEDENTSALYEHLTAFHNVDFMDHVNKYTLLKTKSKKEDIDFVRKVDMSKDSVGVERFTRRRKQTIFYEFWKYFTKLYRYKVICNLCKKAFKYSFGRVSNLIRHLQTRHFFELPKNNDSTVKDNTVWKYFTVLNKRRAQCNLCDHKNIFFYSGSYTTSLLKHVRRVHTCTRDENSKVHEVRNVSESNIDMKSLFDYFVSDSTLSESIRYEDEQIVCQSCTGTFLCDDLINFEATIRYHVQNCHAVLINDENASVFSGNNVISYYNDPIEARDLYDSEYNELEEIANEINSFDQ